MPKFINLNKTNVVKYGTGKQIAIGFHGWAGAYTDLDVFGKWIDKKKYTLYIIEFPGRGRTKSLNSHDVEDLVEFIKNITEALSLKNFFIVSDCGFSQVAIKYAHLYPNEVKGLFLIYMPMLIPNIFKLRKFFYPIILLFSKTRKFDPYFDKLRKNEKVMHKLFVDGNPEESKKLALIDISNKRKTDLRAAFQSAHSMMKTSVLDEWKNLKCKIEVIAAEKDELMSTKLGLKYLYSNPNVNLTLLKNHKHHWDKEFIDEMRKIFQRF